MEQSKEYYAFISYKSEDVEWAIWLQHELEHYHLPASFNGRTDIRQELRPVFRDIDELSAGNLPEQIQRALSNSQNLIVICSPQAATSPWVNQEIETFISLGKTDRIFPFIVEGDSPKEFFPPALLNLPKRKERLGGDAKMNGRDMAFVKVVAGMLGVGFDTLWNRYEKEKTEEERKQREQRDNLLRLQSGYLAEKAKSLVEEGDSYSARVWALEALPKDLKNPNRPFDLNAEIALRISWEKNNAILHGHIGIIYSASFSPDGNRIVSASSDKTIRVWDTLTGTCMQIMEGHAEEFHSVSFSPDGKKIVSVSFEKTIRVWDAFTGTCMQIMEGYAEEFFSASFSPDGLFIVSTSNDNIIRVWGAYTGTCLQKMEGHTKRVYSTLFSPDGKYIVSASIDNTIRVWNALTGTCLTIIDGDAASFSPDGFFIVSASDDNIIRVWGAYTGTCLQKIEGHTESVYSTLFSPDGKYIVSASIDNTIRVWDWITGTCLHKIATEDTLYSLSPDGKRIVLVSDDNTISVWDVFKGACLQKMENHTETVNSIHSVPFSPDGNSIVSTSDTIRIWDCTSKSYKYILEVPDNECQTVAFSSDGKRIFALYKGFICIWNTKTGKCEKKIDCDTHYNEEKIVFSPDERIVVTLQSTKGEKMYIRDANSWKLLHSIEGSFDFAYFSSDSKKIVSISKDLHVFTWDALTGKSLQKQVGYFTDSMTFGPEHPYIHDFCPNTNQIILEYWYVSNDNHILYLSGANQKECVRLDEGYKSMKDFAVFNPDGSLIALANANDGNIQIRETSTGRCLQLLRGDASFARFSPDGQHLFSLSSFGPLSIWDVNSGICIQSLKGDWGYVSSLNVITFSPDGRYFAFLDCDGIVRVWEFPPLQELIDETRERFKNRPLTQEERRKYYLE